MLAAQLEATEPILDEPGIDVLLWPEGGSDIDPTRSPDVADIFDDLSEQLDAPVVLNTVTTRDDEFFNTSLLWRAGEGAVDSYDKRNPVPFGEYIPDRAFWEPLAPDLIGLIQRGYTPGTNAPVFDLGSAVTGLAICFDVIYDELIWEGARDGAELYMFQTNNADFTRHGREPAAAGDRAPAGDRDRAIRGEHLDGRHQPGHRPDRAHDRCAPGLRAGGDGHRRRTARGPHAVGRPRRQPCRS